MRSRSNSASASLPAAEHRRLGRAGQPGGPECFPAGGTPRTRCPAACSTSPTTIRCPAAPPFLDASRPIRPGLATPDLAVGPRALHQGTSNPRAYLIGPDGRRPAQQAHPGDRHCRARVGVDRINLDQTHRRPRGPAPARPRSAPPPSATWRYSAPGPTPARPPARPGCGTAHDGPSDHDSRQRQRDQNRRIRAVACPSGTNPGP